MSSVWHGARVRWIIIAGIAILLFSYTVLRAINVSFSWDESYTFVHHVRRGMFYQQTYDLMGGNHHLLNVWGMWSCMKLFGTGEFALRIPNLLAHLCYLYATARMAGEMRNTLLAVAAFLLLNLHPYLLDFFSLARGYGLSYGFMMLSLWYAWRYLEENYTRRLLLYACVFAALSAMSHIIMVNYLLAFAASLVVWWLIDARRNGLRRWWGHVLTLTGVVVAGLAVVMPNALGLFKGGSLNVGSPDLWPGTVRTLGEKIVYHQGYEDLPLTIMGRVLMAWGAWILMTVFALWRSGDGDRRPPTTDQSGLGASLGSEQVEAGRSRPFFFGLLVLGHVLLAMWMQHVLFDVPWPQSRTALFFVPLLMFILVASFMAWPWKRVVPSAVAGMFCVPLLFHMEKSANLTSAVEWRPSGELRRMLEIIRKDHAPFTKELPFVTLTSSDESWGALTYYRTTRDLHWLLPRHRRYPDPFDLADYYIVEFDGFEQVDTVNWTLLYHSEQTLTALFRDERARTGRLEVLFHADNDMEDKALPGSEDAHHFSGRRCVRLDTSNVNSGDLYWVVPRALPSNSTIAVGTMMLRQSSDDHWMALTMRLDRDGKTIESWDTPSAPQIPQFNEWCRVGIALRFESALLPGDRITFVAWPTWTRQPGPAMYVDDLEFHVLH